MRLSVISLLDRILAKPKAAAAPTATQEPQPTMGTDQLKLAAPLRHARFADDPTLAQVAAGQATLAPGAKGEAAAKVQQALQDMAFVLPSGVDGAYGNQTVTAVKNFQSMAGLKRTGVVDADTLKALDRYAPPAGQTSWSEGADPGPVPNPDLGNGRKARVVVDTSQHRLFLFDKNGDLEKIYGVRSGNNAKGWGTKAGIKVIDGKNNNPTEVAKTLWGGTGNAFGTRLLNLSDYNLETNTKFYGKNKGQELHGTYDENSIGQDFSHGCVGLKNADIEEIYDKLGNGELVKFQD
jgi:lipoprotein-anchoring transpeptidase ErfK/SrfK